MAGADLESVFRKLAIQFQVTESNFLLLVDSGISTASEMAHRIDKESLEEILENRIRSYKAWRDDEDQTILVWSRDDEQDPDSAEIEAWATFKTGQEAGAIRRLFSQCQLLAQSAAKKELGEGTTPKVTSMEMVELAKKALEARVFSAELTESETPGPLCLTDVRRNYSTGGNHVWMT